jgi:hypothetical protein
MRLGLPSDLFPHGFPTNYPTHPSCPYSCPGHLHLLDFSLKQSISDKHTTFWWLSLSRETVSLSDHPMQIPSWLQMIGEATLSTKMDCCLVRLMNLPVRHIMLCRKTIIHLELIRRDLEGNNRGINVILPLEYSSWTRENLYKLQSEQPMTMKKFE